MNDIIKKHYEDCLAKHGPNYRGMDWPNPQDAEKRYEVMEAVSGMIEGSILDLGCGAGLFRGWLNKEYFVSEYVGIDISPLMIAEAKKKYPNVSFYCRNILKKPFRANSFDYVIMNGVLTMKCTNTQEQMWDFAKKMIKAAFKAAIIGIAFNVMSKHVDWERDDLFHVGFDEMAAFLTKEISRHFVFRNDYGLYEYSVYCYKSAQ